MSYVREYELVWDNSSKSMKEKFSREQVIRKVSMTSDYKKGERNNVEVTKSAREPLYVVHYVRTTDDGGKLVRTLGNKPGRKKPPLTNKKRGTRSGEVTTTDDERVLDLDTTIEQGDDTNMVGLRVIACYMNDGMYYQGHVTGTQESRHYAIVRFQFRKNYKVRTQMIIPMEGAITRPELAPGDFVLVCVYNQTKCTECYVPGIVEVSPVDLQNHAKFYSVLLYNGQRDITLRKFIVKISRARFEMTVKYIQHIQEQKQFREVSALSDRTPRSRGDRSDRSSQHSQDDRTSDDGVSTDTSSRPGRGRKKKKRLVEKLATKGKHSKRRKSKSGSRSGSRSSRSSRSRSRTSSRSSRSTSRSSVRSRSHSSERSSSRRSSGKYYEKSKNSSEYRKSSKISIRQSRKSTDRSQKSQRSQRSISRSSSRSSRSRSPNDSQRPGSVNGTITPVRSRSSSSSTLRSGSGGRRSRTRSRTQSRSSSRSRSRSKSPRSGASTPMQHARPARDSIRTPIPRPSNPVPGPRPTSPHPRSNSFVGQVTRNDIYCENNAVTVETRVSMEEKDKMIGQLQYELEKQKRKQFRQEKRLVRQARKINKINRKMKVAGNASPNRSLSPARSDRTRSRQSSVSEADSHNQKRIESPDGTSYKETAQSLPSAQRSLPGLRNQEVLARWKDDGWYYRGRIEAHVEGQRYIVADATGYLEEISRDDILTETEHGFNSIQPQDNVIGLHPQYVFSYAPAEVIGVYSNQRVKVEFFDGHQAELTEEEVYKIPRTKYDEVLDYIKLREKLMVGRTVVARDNDTGVYRLAVVDSRVGMGQQYYLKWLDGGMCKQSSNHIFDLDQQYKRFSDFEYILAPSKEDENVYIPVEARVAHESPLTLSYRHRGRRVEVSAEQCVWLNQGYHKNAVDYMLAQSNE